MTSHHIMRRATALTSVVLLIGCAGPPPDTSPADNSHLPDASPTATASTEGIALAGTIIFNRGTYYIANADGSDEHQLADPSTYCCQARISPDHTRILTMPGTDETGSVRGGILSLDGRTFQLLPRPDKTLNLVPQAWSPDGTRIAFEGWDDSDPSRTGVYTARLDGSDLVRVTISPGLPHDMPLDYSPDGTQLVFHRAAHVEPSDLGGSLWVVNVDGSDAHQLDTGDVRPWWEPRWSPDGSRILFTTERLQPTGPLWTIKPDGTGLRKVFEDPAGGFVIHPAWSPDGQQIMFSLHPINDAFVHVSNAIYAINADGGGLTLVVGGPGFKYVSDWWD
jgi:Tol biopolymer transport system component